MLDLQPVAQICRLCRQHAVAEEAEHRRVLALQSELELCVVFLEIIDVGHESKSTPARSASPRPWLLNRLGLGNAVWVVRLSTGAAAQSAIVNRPSAYPPGSISASKVRSVAATSCARAAAASG